MNGPRAAGPFARNLETRPAFARLAATHALSAGGDALVTIALAGSVFFNVSVTEAKGRVLLSLVLTVAPFAVVAPLLGPAMDRHPQGRRVMLIGASLGRAVTALLMVMTIDNLLLFPVAFGSLVFSKAHGIAKASLVPLTVKSERRLVEANSKLALTSVISGFVAAGPGFLLMALSHSDARWVLRLAFVVFLFATFTALRVPVSGEEPIQDVTPRDAPPQELDVNVSVAATAMASIRLAVGFVAFLLAFSLRRQGAAPWEFGLVVAASMASSFVGAGISPALRNRVKEERLMTSALLIMGAGSLLAAQLDGLYSAMLLAGSVGLATSVGKMAFDSLVQRDAPGANHGRDFARFEAGFQLVWVLGAILPVSIRTPQEAGEILVAAMSFFVAAMYLFGRKFLRRIEWRLPRLPFPGR